MPYSFLLNQLWTWLVDHGIPIAILVVIGVLIPRIARWVIRKMTYRMPADTQDSKGQRAILGALVYVIEAVAYFILIVNVMKHFGFTLAGAAIPATVISAAIGFGAQKFIGDFLGGFFIITEQQYGIGDWVQFNTSAGPVEGDVIKVTMRATTIRTLSGEEIIIPNGETSYNVNYSNAWSRAVVLTTLPLSAAENIDELIDRTTAAAHRALERDDVKPSVISELKVQPFSKVVVPEVAGVPWQAVIRMIIDVQPGEQWHVEREIRKEIAREWWHELTAVATDDIAVAIRESGLLTDRDDDLPDPIPGKVSSAGLIDGNKKDAHSAGNTPKLIADDTDPAKFATQQLAYAPHLLPTIPQMAKESRQREEQQELARQRARERREQDNPTEEIFLGNEHARSDMPRAAANRTLREENEKQANKLIEEETKRKKGATSWRRWITLGGRMRTSTALLFLSLFLLGLLSILTIDPGPEVENKGWLAPPRPTTQSSTPAPKPTTPAPSPTQSTPEDTLTTTEETTPETTDPYGPEGSQDGTAPQQSPGTSAPQQSSPNRSAPSSSQSNPSQSSEPTAPTTSQRQGLQQSPDDGQANPQTSP